MKRLLCILVSIFLFAAVASAADTTITANLTGSSNMNTNWAGIGNLSITTNGIDSSTWHPGQTGQINTFMGSGDFAASIRANSGNYGALGTYVNASTATGAAFLMTDTQNFNILSANHNNNVVGNFAAGASGTNAAMNMKSIGSMYLWSEATDPYSAAPLQGSSIFKQATTTKDSVQIAGLYVGVSTTGTATMSNSNIWGWGISENGNAYTNYGSGTRNISSTGAGTLSQNGFGANNFSYNANYTMPGGGSVVPGGFLFNNGISGTYNMSAQ